MFGGIVVYIKARREWSARQQRRPALDELSLQYRGDFIYLTTTPVIAGEAMPLCRLTYRGNIEYLGFAMYLASSETYENSVLHTGRPTGTPEQALGCACGLYLGDPTAWN